VTEAFSKEEEQFGEKRLETVLKESVTQTPEACVKAVENAVVSFSEGCEQSDDITLLVIAKR